MANFDENQIDQKGMLMEGNTTHIVAIRNGVVIVEPPICDSKRYYLNRLHEKIQVVCDYSNLRSEVFDWYDRDAGYNAGIYNCNRSDVHDT